MPDTPPGGAQAMRNAGTGKVDATLGLAVANVLDDSLLPHSGLDDCWCPRMSPGGALFRMVSPNWDSRREVKDRAAIFYGKLSIDAWQGIRGHLRRLDKETQAGFARDKEAVYRQLADLMITRGRIPEAQRILDLLKAEEYQYFVRGAASGASVDAIALTAVEKELHER